MPNATAQAANTTGMINSNKGRWLSWSGKITMDTTNGMSHVRKPYRTIFQIRFMFRSSSCGLPLSDSLTSPTTPNLDQNGSRPALRTSRKSGFASLSSRPGNPPQLRIRDSRVRYKVKLVPFIQQDEVGRGIRKLNCIRISAADVVLVQVVGRQRCLKVPRRTRSSPPCRPALTRPPQVGQPPTDRAPLASLGAFRLSQPIPHAPRRQSATAARAQRLR